MRGDHRVIHPPQFEAGMNRHTDRPMCYRETDDGWACSAAATPDLHQQLLEHSPDCTLCARGQRAAYLYWRYAAC